MGRRVAILGGGPGGYVAAVRCAQRGATVTLVEGVKLGGTCLNRGCIPSKIMKTASDLLEKNRHADDFGVILAGEAHLDMLRLQARKHHILQTERQGIERLLKRYGITLIDGWGRIEDHGLLSVWNRSGQIREISWDRLILATGSLPAALPEIPFDGDRVLSSDEALTLNTVPESLLIVGGGVIGCEFASIFAAFGSRVVLVEALDRLLPLPSVDESCSKTLLREMKKRRIPCYTGHVIQTIEKTPEGIIAHLAPSPLVTSPPKGRIPEELRIEKVLVCIGRHPATEGLGLETVGITTDRKGWVSVDPRMATSAPGIYAIGDLLGPEKIMLAHVASMEGLVAAENALGATRDMDYNTVPSAIFTTPEVACVGLTERQALERGIGVRTEEVLFRTNSKAHVIGEIAGHAKIVAENRTGKILGVHMIGPHVTDLIAEGTLAIQTKCTIDQLAQTIHAHPTLSEVMIETAYKWQQKPIHG